MVAEREQRAVHGRSDWREKDLKREWTTRRAMIPNFIPKPGVL